MNEDGQTVTTSPSPLSTPRKKVVLIGGALDPVTFGHLNLGLALEASGLFDEIWYVPCFDHPFGKKMESPEHRLAMCELVAAKIPIAIASDWEISILHQGTTFQSLSALRKARPDLDIYMAIGLDNVDVVYEKWTHTEEVRREFPFVVVPRGGIPEPRSDWHKKSPHIFLDKFPAVTCASSGFKSVYTVGGDVKNLLTPEVLEYIKFHGLYEKTP